MSSIAIFRKAITVGLLSFIFGGRPDESAFQQKDGAWYFHTTLIADADVKSFQVLSAHYAKDKHRVYHGDTYRVSQDYFTTKRSRVIVVERAEPATFRYLNYEYARDRTNVFFEGVLFPVQDIETFQLLDYGFARDRISGYYHQQPVPGSDGSSFVALDTHYSKDARRVFYSVLEPAPKDPLRKTFQVSGADVASFEALGGVTDGADAKDRDHTYRQGRRTTAVQ
jgi:hypothetical protein